MNFLFQIPAKGHQLIELGQGPSGINNLCRFLYTGLQIHSHSCGHECCPAVDEHHIPFSPQLPAKDGPYLGS